MGVFPEAAKVELHKINLFNQRIAEAKQRYFNALASDSSIEQVAFLLFRHTVNNEDDWGDEEVTWHHWWSLQVDSERDQWRQLAVDIMIIVKSELTGETHTKSPMPCEPTMNLVAPEKRGLFSRRSAGY